MNISTIPCGSATNKRGSIVANIVATENWVILKTYAENDRVFMVEWRCDRTTDGFTLPFGGESDVDVPVGCSSDEMVAAIMLEIGPSKLDEMRNFNSEIAIREAKKAAAIVTVFEG